jgi:hypothetical protein
MFAAAAPGAELLVPAAGGWRLEVFHPPHDRADASIDQRHHMVRFLPGEVPALETVVHVIPGFIDRGLRIRQESQDLGRVETRMPLRDVARTPARRVADLRDKLEVVSHVRLASQTQDLSTDVDGEAITMQLGVTLDGRHACRHVHQECHVFCRGFPPVSSKSTRFHQHPTSASMAETASREP